MTDRLGTEALGAGRKAGPGRARQGCVFMAKTKLFIPSIIGNQQRVSCGVYCGLCFPKATLVTA